MKGHLDPDTAADFRAGLITGHRERTIAAHLATCAQCASLTERLAQVSALLTATPVPAMPDSLARRLDEALAAEAEVQKPFIITASVRRPLRKRLPSLGGVFKVRVLAPAAAGLAVLAGAGYGLSLVSGSTASGPASSAAAGSAAEPSNDHRVAAPAMGGTSSSGAKIYENGLSNGPDNDSSGVINVVVSGVDYRSATLEQQVSEELASRSSRQPAPTSTPTLTPASAKLAACVRNVSGRSSLVLVESAHYNGEPATVIVLKQGGQTKAVVVGPTCAVLKAVVLS